MTPAARRAACDFFRERYRHRERRACELAGLSRSTYRYGGRRDEGESELSERLLVLAGERPRFGYRRLHVLLQREGFQVNHKRVHRPHSALGNLASVVFAPRAGLRPLNAASASPPPPNCGGTASC